LGVGCGSKTPRREEPRMLQNSTGRSEGKRTLGRSKPRWVYTTKMDLIEIGWKLGD